METGLLRNLPQQARRIARTTILRTTLAPNKPMKLSEAWAGYFIVEVGKIDTRHGIDRNEKPNAILSENLPKLRDGVDLQPIEPSPATITRHRKNCGDEREQAPAANRATTLRLGVLAHATTAEVLSGPLRKPVW